MAQGTAMASISPPADPAGETKEADGATARKYLTFMQGGERYGVDIGRIREIIEDGQVTTVPMAPEYIRGVINLRGHVIPIVDMERRLGLGSTDARSRACNIIVEMDVDGEHVPLGFTVQSVEEVVDIDDAQVEPAPAFGTEVPSEFIAGMGKVDGQFVTILDISKALAVEILSQFPQRRAQPQDDVAKGLGERSDPSRPLAQLQ